jgi:hypothetical protein
VFEEKLNFDLLVDFCCCVVLLLPSPTLFKTANGSHASASIDERDSSGFQNSVGRAQEFWPVPGGDGQFLKRWQVSAEATHGSSVVDLKTPPRSRLLVFFEEIQGYV